MNKADSKAIAKQLMQITSKEARYLLRTSARLDALRIDISWVKSLDENDEDTEMLDAFVSRYSPTTECELYTDWCVIKSEVFEGLCRTYSLNA